MKTIGSVNVYACPNGGQRILTRMAICIAKYYSKNGKCSEQDLIRSGFTFQQINHFKNIAHLSVQNDLQNIDRKYAI